MELLDAFHLTVEGLKRQTYDDVYVLHIVISFVLWPHTRLVRMSKFKPHSHNMRWVLGPIQAIVHLVNC